MRVLHYGLLAILSLTIVAALKAVGIILAIALLIAPGAIAFLLTRSFEHDADRCGRWSSRLPSVLGVYPSFFIDSAPGADHRLDHERQFHRRVRVDRSEEQSDGTGGGAVAGGTARLGRRLPGADLVQIVGRRLVDLVDPVLEEQMGVASARY